MCGIFGVLGRPGAPSLVKQGLQALEYRGYDSCGAAWPAPEGLGVAKAIGAVANLQVPDDDAATAIGHTRWATHGGVTEANAHPHLSADGMHAVVHNGVLLNHRALRQELAAQGVTFASETDSEALAHLWERATTNGLERLRELLRHLDGTYSIAILDADGSVYVAKNRNPMWVAHVDGTTWFASDPVALRRHVDEAVPLEDGDHGRLSAAGIEIHDGRGRPVVRAPLDIRGLDDGADKAGYEHYMLKEIHETPAAMNRLLASHLSQSPPYVGLGLPPELDAPPRITLLGAGTSYHAGLLGAAFVRRLARVPADAHQTPEYKDALDIPEPGTLLVALSQSGETLDTLQALHRLRSHPFGVLALTNHPTSTIGREADHTLALASGTEISVAATKTFLSQGLLLYLLALHRARRGRSDSASAHAAKELIMLPRALQRTLHGETAAQDMARALAEHDNLFILAKGLNVPAAMEGALKLKEIAYQHAEAYPAGELKHGPFALLTEDTPVVFLLGQDADRSKISNSIEEVAARGAPVYVLAMGEADAPAHHTWTLPDVAEELAPFVFSAALHVLSYWVAKARGLPIDKPRNLAKSVTVE